MSLKKNEVQISYNLIATLKHEEFPVSLILSKILKTLGKSLKDLEYEFNEQEKTLIVYGLPFSEVKKILRNLKDYEEYVDIDLIPYNVESSYYEQKLTFSDELKEVAYSILKIEFLKEPIFWALVVAVIPNYMYMLIEKGNIASFVLMQNISLATLWLLIISIFLDFKFNLGIFLTLILSLIVIYFSVDLVASLNKTFSTPVHVEAGFVEEAYKLSIALFFLKIFTEKSRWKIRNYMLRLGVLIGFIVGISFGIVENIYYAKQIINTMSGLDFIGLGKILGYIFAIFVHIARLFLTSLLHAMWTSVSTFLSVFGNYRPFTMNYIFTGYLLSASLHAFYNYSVSEKLVFFQLVAVITSAFIFYSILKYVQRINV